MLNGIIDFTKYDMEPIDDDDSVECEDGASDHGKVSFETPSASPNVINSLKRDRFKSLSDSILTCEMPQPKTSRRGRPKKPDPVINMTATTFIEKATPLTLIILHKGVEIGQFSSNQPRETRSGKVGWTFSSKINVDIDNVIQ